MHFHAEGGNHIFWQIWIVFGSSSVYLCFYFTPCDNEGEKKATELKCG